MAGFEIRLSLNFSDSLPLDLLLHVESFSHEEKCKAQSCRLQETTAKTGLRPKVATLTKFQTRNTSTAGLAGFKCTEKKAIIHPGHIGENVFA